MLGMTKQNRMVRAVGARIMENSSDLVLDIWAMMSLQQMLEKTVPVRKNMHRGSRFRMSLREARTQMKNMIQATMVDTMGLSASYSDLFLPVPCNVFHIRYYNFVMSVLTYISI